MSETFEQYLARNQELLQSAPYTLCIAWTNGQLQDLWSQLDAVFRQIPNTPENYPARAQLYSVMAEILKQSKALNQLGRTLT